jgi:hypothetical protein
MTVPGELIIPLRQFWHLEATPILLCDQLGCFNISRGSIPLPHMTTGCDLVLIHMKSQDFTFREFLLPLISNTPMLEIAKRPIGIHDRVYCKTDGCDHFFEHFGHPLLGWVLILLLAPLSI